MNLVAVQVNLAAPPENSVVPVFHGNFCPEREASGFFRKSRRCPYGFFHQMQLFPAVRNLIPKNQVGRNYSFQMNESGGNQNEPFVESLFLSETDQ